MSAGKIDNKLGILLFRNRSGLSGNIVGKLSETLFRGFSDLKKDIDRDSKGFIELDKRIDEDTIARIRKEFTSILESGRQEKEELSGKTVREVYRSTVNDVSCIREEVDEILDTVGDEVKSFYGSPIQVKEIALMKYSEIDSDELEVKSTRSWHLDPWPTDHARIFVLLTDIEKEGATSEFLTRSATRDSLKNWDEKTEYGLVKKEFEQELEQKRSNELYGKSGKAALTFPAHNMHRANDPEGERKILVITVRPSFKGSELYRLYSEKEYNNKLSTIRDYLDDLAHGISKFSRKLDDKGVG